MKKLKYLASGIFTVITVFSIFSSLTSCGNNSPYTFSTDKKEQADSVVKKTKGLEKITALRNQYKKEGNREGEILALKKLGKEYRKKNRFTDAITAHTEGAALAKEIGDTIEIIQSLNNIGTNYRRMGILNDAAVFHFRALKMCMDFSDKESYNARKNRVVSLNGIGNISLTLNDIVTADSVFREALKGERELKSAVGQAINYANIGSLFETKNQLDSAWYYYKRSMEMNEQAKSYVGISLCHTYFGHLYELEGNMNKAIDEYKMAYTIMEEKVDKWHWLASCLALVKVYIKQQNFATASAYLAKAEKVATEANSLEHLAEINHCYYQIYKQRGNYKKALDAYILSEDYYQKIAGEKNVTQMQNERVRYEYDRRQREIDDIHSNYLQEKKYKTLIAVTSIVIVILAVITIGLLYYSLRLRKKKQISMHQLEQIRSSFFTNITHEFRTPLTVIIGLAERLKSGETVSKEEIQTTGKMIGRQGNGLLELINQLLEISKVKSTIGTSEYRNGDIVGYIHTIVEGSRELTKQKQIELVYKPSQPQIVMDFIPDYVHKIMRNLLSNAIKYTPEFGRIYITTEVKDDNLRLQIADSGKGIPFKDIPHIFDSFYQGGNSKGMVGTGVGLALIRQLTEAMNGHISVRSAEGEGSIFIIDLPLKHGKEEWEKIENEDIVVNPQPLIDNEPVVQPEDSECKDDKCPTVLIIEDNTDISFYISSVLKGKHSLYYAQNGKEGMQKALGVMPDIIITDLMMPEMDGLELCREIRKSEILNHIPIIVITAKCTEQDKIEGLKAGADAYLFKPFNSDELNVTINSLLERRKKLQQKYTNIPTEIHHSQDTVTNVDREFITKIVDVVYARMQDGSFDINAVASVMCMSPRQLNRKVLAITGDNASKYIMQIRMTKAKKLLEKEKKYTISEIAIRCGFEENSNFTRAFKNAFNMTPSQYRKMPANSLDKNQK